MNYYDINIQANQNAADLRRQAETDHLAESVQKPRTPLLSLNVEIGIGRLRRWRLQWGTHTEEAKPYYDTVLNCG